MTMKILAVTKKCLILVMVWPNQNTKMNDKNAAARLKAKIYSFLVDDNSGHKKAKSININFN